MAWALSVPSAEVAFRVAGDLPASDLRGLYEQFGDGNYRHAPLVETNANWSTGRFSVYTDALGLRCDRGRKRAVEPGAEVEVLVIGDSQGYGQGVDYEDSLAGALAEIAAERHLRVANASVGGHYLANQFQLVRWLKEVKRLRPRKVLVLLTPFLISTSGDFSRVNVGVDGRLYSGAVGLRQTALVWVKTHMVLYARLRDALRAKGIASGQDRSANALTFYRTGPTAENAQPRLLLALRQFLTSEALHASEICLVYTPLTLEFDFDPVRRAAAAKGVSVDSDQPFHIASAVADMLHVSLVDLRPTLKALRSAGHALSLRGDPHYTGPVSKACATAVWSALQARMD